VDDSKILKLGVALWIVSAVIGIAFWAAVIAVLIHFA
jgi:hypothetical protein